MDAAAFVQVVAALDGQLAPGSDGMPFGCFTQLAGRIVPQLVSVRAELRERRALGKSLWW